MSEGIITANLILGQYVGNIINYKGHAPLGMSFDAFSYINKILIIKKTIAKDKTEDEEDVYIEPSLVCTLKYMMINKNGSMRQPVFKGLRVDKSL